MNKKLFFAIGVCIIPLFANAQFWEVGAMLGGSNYSGDLSPTPMVVDETHFAGGAFVRANISRNFTAKGNIYYGTVSGSDENAETQKQRERNLNFRSRVLEIGLNGELNLTKFEAGSRKYRTAPYLFGGIAIFKFDPEALYNDKWVRLQPLGTEGQGTTQYNDRKKYGLTQVSFPFGAGLKHNFSEHWNIGLEVGWRKTFTDYLDDVSTTYVEDYIIRGQNGDLAANLSDRSGEVTGDVSFSKTGKDARGNETNKDWYMFGGITLSYTIIPRTCFRF